MRARGRYGLQVLEAASLENSDPEGFPVLLKQFLKALAVKNYSERTLLLRQGDLLLFVEWCEARAITRPCEVTKQMLERYQRQLFLMRKKDGKRLSLRTQAARLVSVRFFFRWLTRQNFLLWNPASELELPRAEQVLPRDVLTESEAELVLEQPDLRTPIGLRDRAILEVLYSTGIRRMELCGLGIYDVSAERGVLLVRLGKGKKDRVVPIGERALHWVQKYLDDVRSQLVMPPDEGVLFLTARGEPLAKNHLTDLTADYVKASGVGKRGACHLFRHTAATLMLENGADIRFVQEMLGHASLESTQIYTQVSIKKLQAVHALTHPGAKLVSGAELAKTLGYEEERERT